MHGHNLSHHCPNRKEYGVALRSRLLQVALLAVLRKDPQPWQHLPSLGLSMEIHPISTSAFITLLKRRNAILFGYLLLCFMQAMKASSAIWRGTADCASAIIGKKNTNGSHRCPSATIFLFTQEQSAFVCHVIFGEKYVQHAKMLRVKCTAVGKQLHDVSMIGVTNPHSLLLTNAWLLEKARVRCLHLTLCSVVFSTIHTFEVQYSNP